MKPFDKLKKRLREENLISDIEHENLKYYRVFGAKWHIQDGGYSCFFMGEDCRVIQSYNTVKELLKSKEIKISHECNTGYVIQVNF